MASHRSRRGASNERVRTMVVSVGVEIWSSLRERVEAVFMV
jgi:hypothetical protein